MESVHSEQTQNRLGPVWSHTHNQAVGKTACFVSYTCAGDPDYETSLRILQELVEAGVDILEVGVPFSDPLADGPTNQHASERALQAGLVSEDVFRLVRDFRSTNQTTPIVFYTYYNLLFSRGIRKYVEQAKKAGVDAILVLDLPPEEAEEDYLPICADVGMETVFIVAPTTPPERLPKIVAAATGFIYYVSREGVTGVREDDATGVDEAVLRIKRVTDLPIVVGFGISNQSQVRATASIADGVVVGSAIVKRVEALQKAGPEQWDAFSTFIADLVQGCYQEKSLS